MYQYRRQSVRIFFECTAIAFYQYVRKELLQIDIVLPGATDRIPTSGILGPAARI